MTPQKKFYHRYQPQSWNKGNMQRGAAIACCLHISAPLEPWEGPLGGIAISNTENQLAACPGDLVYIACGYQCVLDFTVVPRKLRTTCA